MKRRAWPFILLGFCFALTVACEPLGGDPTAVGHVSNVTSSPSSIPRPSSLIPPSTPTPRPPAATPPIQPSPLAEEALIATLMMTPTVMTTIVTATMAATVEPPVFAAPRGVLSSGQPVGGDLAKGETDLWTFAAEGGRFATITLNPDDENADLTLALLDPEGRPLATSDNGYTGDPEIMVDVLLPNVGVYAVAVAEFFNENGRYQLNLVLTEEPQFREGGRLETGQAATGDLLPNTEHSWTFSGAAGQAVGLTLMPLSEQLDVIVALQGPDGRRLAALDEGFSGDAEVITGFELPDTGDYTVRVTAFAGHSGDYTLLLEEGSEETADFYDAGELALGAVRREVLRQDEAHAWFFSGAAGEIMTLVVSPIGPNMDMDVWLLNADLERLQRADAFLSGEGETMVFTLPAEGEYMALVQEFFGEAGEYEISLWPGAVEPDVMPNGR